LGMYRYVIYTCRNLQSQLIISGTLECRFPPGDDNMMHLGNLLKDRIKAVNPSGGLLFRVKERDHREPSTNGTIKEAVLEDMIKKKKFKMDRFMIFISHEAARTELQFCLRYGIWTTISGFPRRLVNDHESK
jgi:hypothetical protein